MHPHGVPAIFVIPVMIAIIFLSRSNKKAVLWTTLVLVGVATCFFAVQGAVEDHDSGGLLGVGAFVIVLGIGYLIRSARKNKP